MENTLTLAQEFLLRCIRTRAGKCGYGLSESELYLAVPLVDQGLIEALDPQPFSHGTWFRITPAGRKLLK